VVRAEGYPISNASTLLRTLKTESAASCPSVAAEPDRAAW
jgi:hypothetical protein